MEYVSQGEGGGVKINAVEGSHKKKQSFGGEVADNAEYGPTGQGGKPLLFFVKVEKMKSFKKCKGLKAYAHKKFEILKQQSLKDFLHIMHEEFFFGDLGLKRTKNGRIDWGKVKFKKMDKT